MKKVYLILLLIILSMPNFAQQIKVIDSETNQVLQGVHIYNQSKTVSVTTNKKGEAMIDKFVDTDEITISFLGYETQRISKSKLYDNSVVKLKFSVITLNTVVLSANKFEEKKVDIPSKIEVISADEVQKNMPQNTAEMVAQTGLAYMQTSQLGGGSLVLRGFEANKVLMVVDGVRLNNAIYRSGHLQSAITIDPYMLERTEIVYGPGSVIYGSDAIGGVVSFQTKRPVYSSNDKLLITGSAMTRYASAANEYGGSVFLNIASKKFASITNVSYKNIGDLTIGRIDNPLYGDWGKNTYYVERINDKDSVKINPNPYTMLNSGYYQYDVLQKFSFKASEKAEFSLNFQYSNSSNIPRSDRLLEMSGGVPKYAEWYYGPQTRLFSYFMAHLKNSRIYNDARLIIGYQNISEDRISRKINKTYATHQEETVNLLSINADLQKNVTDKNELRYGFEFTYNDIGSYAYNQILSNGETKLNAASRYPDGENYMMNYAVYLTHNWEISKKLVFSQGIRFSGNQLECNYTDTMMSITKFPFDKTIKQASNAFNGQLGLVYMPGKDWRFAINFASGYRAPNIDDMTKLNDSKGSNHLLIIPNPDLKPEYVYNSELTIGKVFNKSVQVEVTGFYSYLIDALQVRPTTFGGADSTMFDGNMCAVQSMQNVGEATIYGFQGSLAANVTNNFSIVSNLTYTYARLNDDDKTPLDHIPPIYGMTSFRLKLHKFSSDIYFRYNGWKKLEDYSPSGEDNLQVNPTDANGNYIGMPAWYTANIKISYLIVNGFTIQGGVENIFDAHYRYFASGISAPGRNFMISLRANF